MTLTRPWCAGEIATADSNSIPIVLVACDDYTALDDAGIASIDDQWSQQQIFQIGQYGVVVPMIKQAYKNMLAKESLKLNRFLPFPQQEAIVGKVVDLCKLSRKGALNIGKTGSFDRQVSDEPGRILISGCTHDAEAVCAFELLRKMTQFNLQCQVRNALTPDDLLRHLPTTDYFVIVLTKGLLQDTNFGLILLKTELLREAEPVEIVTVLADNNFAFPSPEFFDEIEKANPASSADLQYHYGQVLARAFRRMLNILALPFTPSGSWVIMQTQVREINVRFKKCFQDNRFERQTSGEKKSGPGLYKVSKDAIYNFPSVISLVGGSKSTNDLGKTLTSSPSQGSIVIEIEEEEI